MSFIVRWIIIMKWFVWKLPTTYVIIIATWLRICLNISADRIRHKNMLIKFVFKHFSLINMCVYEIDVAHNIVAGSTYIMETKV